VALAVGIIIAEPDSNGDVVGEAHEPRIVLIIRRAGLPGNKRCKVSDGARGATRQDALHHALALIPIDLGLEGEIAEAGKTFLGFAFDAAVEEMHRRKVARVLQGTPQGSWRAYGREQ
jgi:hypothetical protein